ncbi:MAG: carbohydrate kinase [Chitinophagaceae bacterium]|nr:carbohydrate kinase [Chitinophagaceae bacterium]
MSLNLDQLFADFSSLKVGVIGDVMLDTYWWGRVDRISPEAPVPIVALYKKDHRIGGAGNVALNLAALGTKATVLSVIGNDDEGNLLTRLFRENNIDDRYLARSDKRITTNKSRIISRNQQMMRLDAEITSDLQAEDEEALLQSVGEYVSREKPNVIIFEDYNKGVLTENIITKVIELCKQANVITTVDPKRKNFFSYTGVDIFKPNLTEVKDGLNLLINDVDLPTLQEIHHQLQQKIHHQISFITLSEKGVFYQDKSDAQLIPSHLRNIADVSGAGDTVIAVASVLYAATRNVQLMAEVANIAGGLVCEDVGTVAINKTRLLEECKLLLPTLR